MSFKEFDLTEYIIALEDFKKSNTGTVIEYWGSVDNFDLFVQKIRDDEEHLASLAIKTYGSIEKYTEDMKYNLEHFSEIMEDKITDDVKEIGKQSDALYAKLAADLTKEIASDEIQSVVHELDCFMHKHASTDLIGNDLLNVVMKSYSSDYMKTITDRKYGVGAADYIVAAFQYYIKNSEKNS